MRPRRFRGFGSLKSPHDLLRKVQHDFRRMQAAPADVYAAFDFFVSAYHLLDWVHPNDEAGRLAEETKQPLLQVCSHIANGAKHFEATKPRHKSVKDVVANPGKFFGGDFFGGGFFGSLTVQLDGQSASLWGAEISAVDLASIVLKFWESDPRLVAQVAHDA